MDDSPPQPASTTLTHLPALDGLRGVAIILVVTYHLQPSILPGGFIGVDVFFVLSGFLISSLLIREGVSTGGIDFVRFFVRRLRRLLPAMLLLVAALSLYAATWAEPNELARLRRHGFATLGYVANWLFVADGTTYSDVVLGASPLRHVWSLSIEEQFYIVLALGALAVATLSGWAKLRVRFGISAATLAAVSALWMAWLSTAGASTERTYFGTDTRAHAMLVGAVLGAVLLGRPVNASRSIRAAGIGGCVTLMVVAVVASEAALWMHRGGFFVVAVASGAVIIAGISDPAARRILTVKPLILLGTLSYGVYLWHWPVLIIFDERRVGIDGLGLLAVRLALTLSAAVFSYVVVERPIRSGAIGRRWGRRGAWAVPVSLALVIGMLIAATVPPSRAPAAAAQPGITTIETSPPTTMISPASDTVAVPGTTPTPTTTAVAAESSVAVSTTTLRESVSIAVVGDSVAHTVIGGELAGDLRSVPWTPDQTTFDAEVVQVNSLAKPACSFLPGDVAFLEANGSYNHADLSQFCGEWRDELGLTVAAVDVVVVHLSNDLEDRWIDGNIVEFGTSAHLALLTGFLDDVWAVTNASGTSLAVVVDAPRESPMWLDAVGEREDMVGVIYREWAGSRSDVVVIDLGDVVCPLNDCSGVQGGFDPSWRWDGRHYTRVGAVWVAGWLTPQLLAAGS
ncbi:MAG: peptidoglycan/LPS O-acetylase OafA/YrhL [Candidatus Aldehydirespiratoraceae bacterium]|jgi:peptidoglycan/LPS O-acetylase OafA/YrhL